MSNISGLMTWCQKAYGGWTTTKPLEICRDTSLVPRLVTWLFVILFVITHLDLIFVIGYCFRKEKVKPFSRHIQPFFLKIRKCFKWVVSNKMRFNFFFRIFFCELRVPSDLCPPACVPLPRGGLPSMAKSIQVTLVHFNLFLMSWLHFSNYFLT